MAFKQRMQNENALNKREGLPRQRPAWLFKEWQAGTAQECPAEGQGRRRQAERSWTNPGLLSRGPLLSGTAALHGLFPPPTNSCLRDCSQFYSCLQRLGLSGYITAGSPQDCF